MKKRNSTIWIFTFFSVWLFFCCQTENKTKQTEAQESESIAQLVNAENNTALNPDTLKYESQKINTNEATLSSSESSLIAQESNLNVDIRLASDNLFDFDKATIKPEAVAELNQVVMQLKKMGNETVHIIGHTDAKGDDHYNKKLSLQRAEAVKSWFKKQGLANQFIAIGKGEKEPIAENTLANGMDNPDGRAKNRRVDIKYIGTQSISK